jgi:oxalate decarboxylase/phosphoglucose isomerase-like protein (cupin superfamily)
MRRFPVLLSLLAVIALGALGLGAQRGAVAQEATPPADGMMQQGVTFNPLAFAAGVEVANPADLFLARFTIDPGASLPLEESDPTGGMLYVESGAFTVQAETELSVTRGAGMASMMATAEAGGELMPTSETVAVGEEATLEAGDAAYIPGSITGEIRNDGDEPAVGLAFLIGPPMGMMAEATPAP